MFLIMLGDLAVFWLYCFISP